MRIHAPGQSLVELIAAIGIVAVGLVAVLALSRSTLRAQATASTQVQAAFLASEGIELVRNLKETNEIAGLPWWTGLRNDGSLIIDKTQFDFAPNNFEECDGGECQLMRDERGFYVHVGCADGLCGFGTPTPFNRLVFLHEVCQGDRVLDPGARCEAGGLIGMEVRSIVAWRSGQGSDRVRLDERLYHFRTL